MTETTRKGFLLGLILLAATVAYANGLSNPFVADDRHIIFINFSSWRSWSVVELFQRSLFSTSPSESSYFRPLTLLTFAVNHELAGERPEGYRAVNIALHLSVIVLVFLLLSRFTAQWITALTALLFALHPAHVQAVTYISSRSDLLYTALGLFSLLLWHKGNQAEGNHRLLYLGSSLTLFFFGLFAKDTMIVIIPLVALIDFIWRPGPLWKNKIRTNLAWYGGLVALLGIYLLIKTSLGFPLLMESGPEIRPISRILIALKLFTLYLGLAFYPVHLSLFRTLNVPQNFFEWQVVLGAILLTGLLTLAWFARKSNKEIAFGIFWYHITILPVLNLTLLNALMMEHWLYLPLIGLSLAFVAVARTLANRFGESGGAAVGLILIALLLGSRTVTRNTEWSDLLKLFSKDVASYPRNSRAWSWLASTMKSRGMLNEAIHAYKTSLALSPNMPAAETWIGLGEALSFLGKGEEAEAALSRAVSLQPANSGFRYILGMHRLKVGKNVEAVEALAKSIELTPSPMTYHALGSAYLRLGNKERAEQAFQRALTLYPQGQKFHADMHVHLGKLYLHEKRRKEAYDEWHVALRFDPNSEAKSLLEKEATNFSNSTP